MNKHHFKHQFNSNKYKVCVALFRNEIIYDVDFSTNRVARVNTSEEEGKKAALISSESSPTDFKADYIDRCVTTALAKVKQKLAFARPSLNLSDMDEHHHDRLHNGKPHPSSKGVSNEIYPHDKLFELEFTFEDGWQGTPQVLCDLIHSFVVNSVLADWFQLTLPAISAEFIGKANADLRNISHEGRSVVLASVPGFYL